MLKLFSLIKRFLRGWPEGRPGGGPHGYQEGGPHCYQGGAHGYQGGAQKNVARLKV